MEKVQWSWWWVSTFVCYLYVIASISIHWLMLITSLLSSPQETYGGWDQLSFSYEVVTDFRNSSQKPIDRVIINFYVFFLFSVSFQHVNQCVFSLISKFIMFDVNNDISSHTLYSCFAGTEVLNIIIWYTEKSKMHGWKKKRKKLKCVPYGYPMSLLIQRIQSIN